MSKATHFPWNYFVRTIRTRIILIVLTSLSTYIICQNPDDYLFSKILLIIFSFIIISFIQGYLRIIPFRKTLEKIQDIQNQLPSNKKLSLIYQENEWVLIQEMLKLTQTYIKEQSGQIHAYEKKSHLIIESIADPLVLLDTHLSCKQYNQAFQKKFIKDKIIKVTNVEKIWKVFDDNEIISLFEKAKKMGEIARLYGHPIDQEFFNISITPITNDSDKITGLLGLFHNVTQSKLTEKLRVDFVANISHEIRTPLTSIKGFSQFLLAQKNSLPINIQSPLERIVSNTERLQDLFDNLLKLSIIESKYGVEKELFDLGKLVSSIHKNLKVSYPKRDITFKDLTHQRPIFGDKKLLEQVFTNLMDNSIKYNSNKETRIEISVEQIFNRDRVTFTDNGQGIQEADINRIFERFYRVHSYEQKMIDGTGLGLSIVKHIINKHNGQIKVESEIGKGTKFIIELPSM